MKKLLVLLLISALAIFVFAGCDGFTPAEGEGEGEGEGEVEICPTVDISGQFVDADGKVYVKGGKTLDITVTFDVPTEPVAVYVGENVRSLPSGIPEGAAELVVYPNEDKTVYTGKYEFSGDDCDTDYIYVLTCETCAPCKYPITVDSVKPAIGEVEICAEDCTCEGVSLTFTGKKTLTEICGVCGTKDYCEDCCSGFAGTFVAIYDKMPFDDCCDTPCAEPIDSGSGDCQVDFESICLAPLTGTAPRTVFALVSALDNVGNELKWLVEITINYNVDGEVDYLETRELADLLVDWPDLDDCVDSSDFYVCTDLYVD
jgi:hypothetical protein